MIRPFFVQTVEKIVLVFGLHAGGIDRLDEIADQIVLRDLLGFARQRHLVQSAIAVIVIAGITSQGVLQIADLFAR